MMCLGYYIMQVVIGSTEGWSKYLQPRYYSWFVSVASFRLRS